MVERERETGLQQQSSKHEEYVKHASSEKERKKTILWSVLQLSESNELSILSQPHNGCVGLASPLFLVKGFSSRSSMTKDLPVQ